MQIYSISLKKKPPTNEHRWSHQRDWQTGREHFQQTCLGGCDVFIFSCGSRHATCHAWRRHREKQCADGCYMYYIYIRWVYSGSAINKNRNWRVNVGIASNRPSPFTSGHVGRHREKLQQQQKPGIERCATATTTTRQTNRTSLDRIRRFRNRAWASAMRRAKWHRHRATHAQNSTTREQKRNATNDKYDTHGQTKNTRPNACCSGACDVCERVRPRLLTDYFLREWRDVIVEKSHKRIHLFICFISFFRRRYILYQVLKPEQVQRRVREFGRVRCRDVQHRKGVKARTIYNTSIVS